jgi:hypothetical protein
MHIRVSILRRYLAMLRHEHSRAIQEAWRNNQSHKRFTPIVGADIFFLHSLERDMHRRMIERRFGPQPANVKLRTPRLLIYCRARGDMKTLIEEGFRMHATEQRLAFQRLYSDSQLRYARQLRPCASVVRLLDEDVQSSRDGLSPISRKSLDKIQLHQEQARERLHNRGLWGDVEGVSVATELASRLGVPLTSSAGEAPARFSLDELRESHRQSKIEPMSSGTLVVVETIVKDTQTHMKLEKKHARRRPASAATSTVRRAPRMARPMTAASVGSSAAQALPTIQTPPAEASPAEPATPVEPVSLPQISPYGADSVTPVSHRASEEDTPPRRLASPMRLTPNRSLGLGRQLSFSSMSSSPSLPIAWGSSPGRRGLRRSMLNQLQQ